MVSEDLALEIRVLAKQGKGRSGKIAREVGMLRNTVRRYLRAADAVRYGARPPRPGKLAGHEAAPSTWLLTGLRGEAEPGRRRR